MVPRLSGITLSEAVAPSWNRSSVVWEKANPDILGWLGVSRGFSIKGERLYSREANEAEEKIGHGQ